jgi:hypothetical protein
MQDDRKMELFNSREMGMKLAEALLIEIDPDALLQVLDSKPLH